MIANNATKPICRHCGDGIRFDALRGLWLADVDYVDSPVCYPSGSGMHYPVEPVEGIDF